MAKRRVQLTTILLCLLTFVIPSLQAGESNQTQSADSLYNQALNDISSSKFAEALNKIEQLWKLYPQGRVPAEVYFLRGLASLFAGKHKDAITFLAESLRLKPGQPQALLFLGLAYAEPGDFAKAVKYVQESVRIKSDSADAHASLGFIYDRLDRYEDSLKASLEACRLSPDSAFAYNNTSYAYNQLGRAEEALKTGREALRLSKTAEDTALANYNLALSYSKLGKESLAPEFYRKAISGFKQWKRADPDMYYYLGNSYYNIDEIDRAVEAYIEAIKIRTNFAQAHLNLGLAYVLQGDKKSALDQYAVLKSLDPDRAEKLFSFIYKKKK